MSAIDNFPTDNFEVAMPSPAAATDAWPAPVTLSELPPPAAFPMDVMPPDVRNFIREGAASLNCENDFFGVPILAAIGGVVGNTRRLQVKSGYLQSAALYAGYVARPGANKSAALRYVMAPISAAESAMRRQSTDGESWPSDQAGEPPQAIKRLYTAGGTIHGIARVLKHNPRGLIWAPDELKRVADVLNQYTSGKGDDRVFLLSTWDHATHTDERGMAERAFRIDRPFLAIVGPIQPSTIYTLMGESRRGAAPPDDGFFDRFLLSYPNQPKEKAEDWSAISNDAVYAWEQAVKRVLTWKPKADGTPAIVHLGDSGREAYQRFTIEHADEVNAADFDDALRGHWSKLRGYCLRLSLIVRCLDCACEQIEEGEVTGDHVRRAAKLIAYFKSHARRVKSAVHRRQINYDTSAVWDAILRMAAAQNPVIRRSDLYKRLRRQFEDDQARLDRILNGLCEKYLLRQLEMEPTGGRPAGPTFEINPKALNCDHDPTKAADESTIDDAGFADFWDLYPHKTNKPAAREAWAQLDPGDDLRSRLMIALRKQIASPRWQKDHGQYIPTPVNWIARREWENVQPSAEEIRTRRRVADSEIFKRDSEPTQDEVLANHARMVEKGIVKCRRPNCPIHGSPPPKG